MIPAHVDRVLWMTAVLHLAIGAGFLLALTVPAEPITGRHPALKPAKFGISIALLLGTMAIVVPTLAIADIWKQVVSWTLAATMVVEMIPIAVQSGRGTTSHFNVDGPVNAAFWYAMVASIVVATGVIAAVAVSATVGTMRDPAGHPLDPTMALAWRASLWLLLLTAWSGFMMGARGSHSIGGPDGGPGLPVVNWSTRYGDLRVSHFIALHAFQALPLTAVLMAKLGIEFEFRWVVTVLAAGVFLWGTIWSMIRALGGRPVY